MIRPYMLAVLVLEGIIRQALLQGLVVDMLVEEVVVLGVLDLAVVDNNMVTFKIKGYKTSTVIYIQIMVTAVVCMHPLNCKAANHLLPLVVVGGHLLLVQDHNLFNPVINILTQ